MDAAAEKARAAANEAPVFITPLDKLRIPRCLLFDLLAVHKLYPLRFREVSKAEVGMPNPEGRNCAFRGAKRNQA